MDLQRIAQQFQSPGLPVRARFGQVVSVNADWTVTVLVGGETTDADVEAAFSSGFVPMDASGGTLGTVTVDDIEYRTHTFTTAGTFEVTNTGSAAVLDLVLIGGGGGGGGALSQRHAGGGGAGRLVELSLEPTLGTSTVAIGTAGSGGVAGFAGGAGGNTQVTLPDTSLVTAAGGGGGGAGASSGTNNGQAGGSGGGGGYSPLFTTSAGGTAVAGDGFGNRGGNGSGTLARGGGGGGAGGAGEAPATLRSPDGGLGRAPTVGYLTAYAGGGGGGSFAVAGLAGDGVDGGGDGGARGDGSAATGYGGGGGGAGGGTASDHVGGAGFAGAAIWSYRITSSAETDDVPIDDATLESNEVDDVRFLGRSVPVPGQTVLLLTDGQDLLAIDSMAADGTTISPRRYRTSDQTIADDTNTLVSFGTAVANDLLGMTGPVGGTAWPTRLYAHIPGWYQATGTVEWAADADGYRRTQVLYNGSAVLAGQQTDTDNAVAVFQTVTTPTFYMAADDYIELRVRHTGGGNLNLTYSSEYQPSLSLTFVGP